MRVGVRGRQELPQRKSWGSGRGRPDLHHVSVPIVSQNVKISEFQNSEVHKNNMFKNVWGRVLVYFRYSGVCKDKNNWFWGLVTCSKLPKSSK